MPLSFKHFAEIYGEDVINSDVVPADMATEKQINKIKSLIETLNVEQETVNKWNKKCNTESFEEMTSIQITGLIDFLEKKIKDIK